MEKGALIVTDYKATKWTKLHISHKAGL
jgi:hypothetical protein